jgi:hypothetical protein
MTLLDAPQFDVARDRRRRTILYSAAGTLFALFIAFWLISGRPVDWPWNWYTHLAGRSAMNHFLADVEQNDLQKAYGVWVHDKDWQQHLSTFNSNPYDRFLASRGYAAKEDSMDKNLAKKLVREYGETVRDKDWQWHQSEFNIYPFDRFQKDWSPNSGNNDFGSIRSHKIVAARVYGNALLAAILINGRKSGALNLEYDPKTHTLLFPPPDVEIDPESYSR